MSSVMSSGLDVVKRTRMSGTERATIRSSWANDVEPSSRLPEGDRPYELTFWPSRVTSRKPRLCRSDTSRRMLSTSRDRSRPRV